MAGDPRGLSHPAVLTIYQDREAALWVGTADGLNKLNRDTERFTHYHSDPDDSGSLSDDYILSIHEDLAGVLWIGTGGGGLNRYDRETESFTRYQNAPSDPNSLSNNMVLSVYEDRSGAIWVGTAGGGVNKLDRTAGRFAHFQSEPQDPTSLSSNMVWSVFQDRNGVLWIGTYGGGLNRYDRASGTFMRYPHNFDDFQSWSDYTVSAIYEDQDGRLWVGTQEGLYTFYREAETFSRWMSQHVVTSILEDGAGVLWVGTLGGLTRLGQSRATVKTYLHDVDDLHTLSSSEVRVVYEDRAGVLWIGTDEGLNRFDRDTERFTRYQKEPDDPSSLSDNFVLSIHEDRSGNLWIGTYGGGLNRFDRGSETFTRYRERDGLPSDVIYGILEDGQGNLWLSTNVGLSKFDSRIETFRNYDVHDGLQSNEFNGGAYYKSSSGEMFFGGIDGFNAFFPERVMDNPYVPPIVLTSLTQSGEDVEVGQALEKAKEVTFHWPNNFFEFEFAALSYCQSDRNQYAYMLEGFDENWNYIGTRRFGRYTNLPGGTYTLRMKGSNNDNVWNEEGISVKVTIVQPFWATWWFRAVIALALVGGVIGGYRLRVKGVELRASELEKQVEERTHALAQRTREIERRRQELEALYLADERMHRHLHLDQVLQALVDVAVDILQADKSAVLVWNERRDGLEVRVVRGFNPESMAHLSFARGEGVTGYVADSGEPVLLEDTLTDPRRTGERAEIVDVVFAEGIRSFMHLPIRIDDEVFAVFNVSFTEPHAFGEDELRLFQALAQRAALAIENAQLYERTQQLVVVEERNRLARELHDAVTQTLFSTSLIAEALPALWENDQEEGRELLQELRQLSRGALAEMRTLLLELRPAALVEASLSDLLRQLGEAVTGRKGVPVAVTAEGEGVIPDEVHVALYRIAQEALNNVVKHAHANQVAVDLRCSMGRSGEIVELCISDDGRGFDPSSVSPDRLGLSIIRERAQAVGATLKIDSKPGVGTKIVVVWREEKQPVIQEDD
jgi:signal transduction histidine kinase/streptogramin lyase